MTDAGIIALSAWDLALASLLLLITGSISLVLQLGLSRSLLVAGARTVAQLTLLGFILHWVFSLAAWWMVVLVGLTMIANAGVAAVQRVDTRFDGIWTSAMIAVSVSSVLVTTLVTQSVIGVAPWYAPRYVIPLLGMVLGNSLTGISLTLDRLVGELRANQAQIEGRLALGASAWEALRPHLAQAARSGMVPSINAMSVVGIVSLPGMMTGQILGGAAPTEAVKYQIVVMFMISGAAGLGTVLAVLLSYRRLHTAQHQLALHRLRGK